MTRSANLSALSQTDLGTIQGLFGSYVCARACCTILYCVFKVVFCIQGRSIAPGLAHCLLRPRGCVRSRRWKAPEAFEVVPGSYTRTRIHLDISIAPALPARHVVFWQAESAESERAVPRDLSGVHLDGTGRVRAPRLFGFARTLHFHDALPLL